MTWGLDNLQAYLLVFVRLAGMIGFNPVFSRRNVPARIRVALILFMTMLLTPISGWPAQLNFDTIGLIGVMAGELFVGFVTAIIFQIFYYLLFFAGDIMDMQFGLSMAKVFDPGTNVQASISGNFLSYLFILYFFATNSHLVLLQAFIASFELVPVGTVQITGEISSFMITFFGAAFSLIMRLTLPFVAAEFVLELAMGVLMKLIPQIHVFVINIQCKILLAFFLLFALSQPIADFIDLYLEAALKSIEKALLVLGGA